MELGELAVGNQRVGYACIGVVVGVENAEKAASSMFGFECRAPSNRSVVNAQAPSNSMLCPALSKVGTFI